MPIKPRDLEARLIRAGATVVNKRGGSGHKTVHYGGARTDLPFHGGGFETDDKLLKKILTKLGLTRNDIGLS